MHEWWDNFYAIVSKGDNIPIVAMLFIVMSVHFTISSRRTEYATLACLGYGGRQLAAAILAQAFGEGACAAIFSVPVGLLLAHYINAQMSQAWSG